MAAALVLHVAVAALLLRAPPRTLAAASEPPGVVLVQVLAAPMAVAAGADLHEAPMVEAAAVTWPAPPEPALPEPMLSEAVPTKPVPATPLRRQAASRPALRPAVAPVSAEAPNVAFAGADVVAAWQAALSAWVEQHRRYPPAARFRQEEGVVQVRFELDAGGRVLRVEVQRESGSAALDAAARALLTGANLPPPPRDIDPQARMVTLPIRYRLE